MYHKRIITAVALYAILVLQALSEGPKQVLIVCEADDWTANKDTLKTALLNKLRRQPSEPLNKSKVNYWLKSNHARIFYIGAFSNGGAGYVNQFKSVFTQAQADTFNGNLTGQCAVSLHDSAAAACAYLAASNLEPVPVTP